MSSSSAVAQAQQLCHGDGNRVDREIESERGREVEETVGKCSGVEGDREGSMVLVHNGWQPWWERPAAWSPRTGQVSSVGAFCRTGVG